MAQPSHQESLLQQIEALEPRFGRARDDIRALVSRARSGDHKGVLQNTRLVVETLLRSLVAKKKQTPGRQTLDQLVSKLQSELPTHIAVHVRTIQAWGNVSAHDHGADLNGEGLSVSDAEVTAALNALVPILTWYDGEHIEAPTAPPAPAPVEAKPKGKLAFVVVGLVGLVGVGVLTMSSVGTAPSAAIAPPPAPKAPPKPAAPKRAALDAFYRAQDVPRAPAECQTTDPAQVEALERAAGLLAGGAAKGDRREDAEAEALLSELPKSAERAVLLAYARQYRGAPAADVRELAEAAEAACPTFGAALNLQAKLRFADGDVAGAIEKFEAAVAHAEGFGGPRVNLALAYVQRGDAAKARQTLDALIEALPEYGPGYRTRAVLSLKAKDSAAAQRDLERATTLDPEDGKAWVLLGRARLEVGDDAAATAAFCKAKALGVQSAARLCK